MIIAGNFKTNHTRTSTLAYARELDSLLEHSTSEVFIFPPLSSVPYNEFNHLQIGVQNAYCTRSGAFSGEVGLEQLEELKIKSVLVGHSERRGLFKEDYRLCLQKFEFFTDAGLQVFFCIGEDLQTKESGKTQEFLASQLEGLNLDCANLIIAYEPIWAIGTGKSATLEEIGITHQFLKSCGVKTLLYGGSVNTDNAKEIMSVESVDGVLVGGASLKVQDFYEIIQQGGKK